MSDDEASGFVARWSRRKAAARDGATLPEPPRAPAADAAPPGMAAPPPVAAAPATTVPAAEPAPPSPPPPTLDDVASLTPDSDFRRFVAPEVEAGVRNAALKRLFTDPHFNAMDGLDVYIDDYGKPDPLPVEMLRQLAQSAFLGGSAQPTMPPGGESAVAENAGPAPALPPSAESSPLTDEDPAVRLQPDDAARSDGDRPHAVDHARRER